MLSKPSILESAANSTNNKSELPKSSEVVEALLKHEKLARKEKVAHSLSDLVGCWNLRFVTGTKKSRQKISQSLPASVTLGAGKYIPSLIKIQITYEQIDSDNSGRVKNSVKFAFLDLSLTGPVKFLAAKNILAFDFTSMKIKILGWKIYDGYIKNGEVRDREFQANKINNQAFFSYFLIQKDLIAARGKGGGLALWGKEVQ